MIIQWPLKVLRVCLLIRNKIYLYLKNLLINIYKMRLFIKIIWTLFFVCGMGFIWLLSVAIWSDENSLMLMFILPILIFIFTLFIVSKIFSPSKKKYNSDHKSEYKNL